jgi:hypothetical protein
MGAAVQSIMIHTMSLNMSSHAQICFPLQVSWPAAGLVLHDPTTGTAAANFTTGMTKVAS